MFDAWAAQAVLVGGLARPPERAFLSMSFYLFDSKCTLKFDTSYAFHLENRVEFSSTKRTILGMFAVVPPAGQKGLTPSEFWLG